MNSYNYWNGVLQKRLSRRRAIAASAGIAFSAALLSACGGDDDEGLVDKSGLLGVREDTSSKGVRGGRWTFSLTSSNHLDAREGGLQTQRLTGPVYDTLLKWGLAVGKLPAASTITGDAAESFELSPDGLQITLKLRPNHKFDPRPPTNGRAMTVQDVKFSFDRAADVSPLFAAVYNPKNPTGGPIRSLSAPDAQTVVISLAYPFASITEVLANWFLRIVPIEADGRFNPRSEARGSGPFMLTTYEPDTKIEYERNPNWYVKDRPFLDGMTIHIIPTYSTFLAQLETGTLSGTQGPPAETVAPSDILRLKQTHPTMVLLKGPMAMAPNHHFYAFSQREDSPFKDIRLRRAVSMLYDRESFIDVTHNVSEFVAAGLPFDTTHTSHLDPKGEGWVDPRDSAFGSNAKYLQYNPEEAKRLISAAAFSGSIDFHWRTDTPGFAPQGELLAGMLERGGIHLNLDGLVGVRWQELKDKGYQSYSGIFGTNTQAFNQENLLLSKYTPGAGSAISREPTPEITDTVDKLQRELDAKRRNAMMTQLQNDLAGLMLDLPLEVYHDRYSVHWPWLKNFNVFQSVGFDALATTGRPYTMYWHDESEKT